MNKNYVLLISLVLCITGCIFNSDNLAEKKGMAILTVGDHWPNIAKRIEKRSTHILDTIDTNTDLNTLSRYKAIWIPSTWAQGINRIKLIEPLYDDLIEYQKKGGNLFLNQPNPFSLPGDTIRPEFLIEKLTFKWAYQKDEYGSEVINDTHPITKNLPPGEKALPSDSIVNFSDNYKVLMRGIISKSPSLMVYEKNESKIVVLASNAGWPNGNPVTDILLDRIITWLIN